MLAIKSLKGSILIINFGFYWLICLAIKDDNKHKNQFLKPIFINLNNLKTYNFDENSI